jgi:hypothetical protein
MDAVVVMLLVLMALVVIDVAAIMFGRESRPGFGDQRR